MKKILTKWWFWAIIVILGVIGNMGDKKANKTEVPPSNNQTEIVTSAPTVAPTSTQTVEPTATPTKAPTPKPTRKKLMIDIEGGKLGEYGKEITLNAGTEFEETFIGYYLPASDYNVYNFGDDTIQVTVYADGTHIEDGWEYPNDSGKKPLVLETYNDDGFYVISVDNGEYVKITGDDISVIFSQVE